MTKPTASANDPAAATGPGEEHLLLAPIWRALGDGAPADDPSTSRLMQSARAVMSLNQRLGLDMASTDNQLARDRLTAFVADISARSGVRPDELVIGSDTDAFLVQNDPAGRSIARFDTRDAMGTPVSDSLARARDAGPAPYAPQQVDATTQAQDALQQDALQQGVRGRSLG